MTDLFVPWREATDTADNNSVIALARDAAALMCRIRQQRPWQYDLLINTGVAPPTVNPLVSRFAWDRICSRFPVTPPPGGSVPFFGGQCPGVNYGIRLIDPDRGVVNNNVGTGNIVGPIQTVNVTIGPPDFQLNNPAVPTGYQVSGTSAVGAFSRNIDTQISTPRRDVRRFYFEIFRIDGLPDNCGNTTYITQYPPTSPGNQITINAPIFGQQRSVTVTFPDFNDINWPNLEWSPVIQFDGITVEFMTEGVRLELPDTITFNPPPVTSGDIETIINTGDNVNSTVNNIENEIENVRNTVNNIETTINNGIEVDLSELIELIKCCCCEENATVEPVQIVNGTVGGVFTLPENTIYVLVEGSGFDANFLRSMEGGGSASKVWFWGWYAVGYGGADGGERINLQYESHSFPVSEGATTLNLSCYTNTTANVTAFVKEKNCNVNG